MTERTARNIRATTPGLNRLKRPHERENSLRRLRSTAISSLGTNAPVSSRETSACGVESMLVPLSYLQQLSNPDTRVDKRVDHIGDNVGHNHEEGEEHDDRLDYLVVEPHD